MSKSFINLSTEQALISAIPALLRFVVTNSVVAIMFSPSDGPRNDVRCAIRFDVTVSREQAQGFALTCHLTAEDNSGAILVAICDPEHDEHALDILEDTRTALHNQGIQVLQMLTTHSLTTAGRWINPDTGEFGPTIPYTDAAITAEVVLEGAPIERSRDAIEAEFTLTDAAPYVAVEGDFEDLVHHTVAELRALITGAGDAPADDLATRAAIIIDDVHLRDALLRIGLGHERAAAQTWTALAAQLRGHARAHVLTVAAFNYYLAGDAVRAGMAIDHVVDAVTAAHLPTPNLVDLLSAALRAGMEPTKLRAIVPTREQAPIPGTDL
jgi:hypothetical protein